MRTVLFPLAVMGIASVLVASGCADLHINPSASSGDPPLPQPSGELPVPPPVDAPASLPPAKPAKAPAPLSTAAKPPAPVETAPDTAPSTDTATEAGASFDNLEIVDAALNGKLAIQRVGSDRTDANLLTVFVGLKNKTPHVLEIEVQTIYKDNSDNPLTAGKASWIPMTLKPHEEAMYRSVAISAESTDFLVRVRQAVGNGQ